MTSFPLRKRIGLFVGLWLLMWLAAACGPAEPVTQEPLERPTLPPLAENKGAVTGVLLNRTGPIPEGTMVYLTDVTWHPDGWAIFYLDPATTLTVPVDSSGYFQALDVEPGDYVFVIGASPENAIAINGEDNQPKVYQVVGGQVLDLGQQAVSLIIPTEFPTTEPSDAYPGATSGESAYP